MTAVGLEGGLRDSGERLGGEPPDAYQDSHETAATDSGTTRSARGAVMLGGRQLLTIVLSAATAVLLARWLTPSDYGLFATLNLIVFGAATLLGDLGLTVSLVRQPTEPPASEWAAARRMTAAMSTAALVGGTIGTALLVNRGDARLSLWVAVLTVALAARFGRSIPSARLQRQQRFAVLAAIETGESALYFVTVITLAASGHGAGSLAIAVGAKEVLGYLAQRWAARGGPKIRRVKGRYRDLIRVGLPIQASGLLVAMTDAFQPIFIGATLGLTSLGLVAWAYNLVLMPILLLGAMDRVVLPGLARVQEDRILLGLLTARAIRLNALVAFPVVIAVLVAPQDLVVSVFSPRWLPAADLLVLFMPAIVTTAMTAPLFHAFNAIGKTRVAMWLSLSWLVLTWTLGAYITATWGSYWLRLVLRRAPGRIHPRVAARERRAPRQCRVRVQGCPARTRPCDSRWRHRRQPLRRHSPARITRRGNHRRRRRFCSNGLVC